MAKFKYLGSDNSLVGRFGRLNNGDIVDLWQSEIDYISIRPTGLWECAEEAELAGVGTILPVSTPNFDLRSVYWLKETVSSLKRMSRTDRLRVCVALRHIGSPIPDDRTLSQLSTEALYETAYGEVKRLRWDQPGYQAVNREPSPPTDIIQPVETPVEPVDEAIPEESPEPAKQLAEPVTEPAVEPVDEPAVEQPKVKRIVRRKTL